MERETSRRGLLTAAGAAATLGLVGTGVTMPGARAETATQANGFGLSKDRTAFVFIEFQREWLAPDGILQRLLIEDKPHFEAAVGNAARIIRAARRHGWNVAHAGLDFSQDPDYRLFNGGRNVSGLRAAIPRAGTWVGEGSRFVEPFVPRDGEFVATGRSGASVLKNATLDPYLRNADVRNVVFLGFASHVCVESSLREAHDLGYNAYMVSDSCAAFTRAQHDHVLTHVVHHFGTAVTTDRLLDRLEGHEAAR